MIAGGPGAQNPELLAPFIDLFVIGDGEPSLPVVCDLWKSMQGSGLSRDDKLARIAAQRRLGLRPAVLRADLPRRRHDPRDPPHPRRRPRGDQAVRDPRPGRHPAADPADRPVRRDDSRPDRHRDHARLPLACAGSARARSSSDRSGTARSRRSSQAALESYHATGYDEISLLSLSTSDYPDFEELVTRMSEVFTPLGVKISLPSLRITEMLKKIPALLAEGRRSGLTLAPEVARDDMREQIRKPINNQDLYDGCAEAFRRGWRKVKLYFMCGLPGERTADLDGIVEMAETIARIGKEVTGRYAEVTASVSNFIPKPHTPYQWNGMQTPRVPPLGPPVPPLAGQAPLGHGQGARHRAEHARRHPDPRRPPGRRRRSRQPGAAVPGSTPGASTSTPGSGGTPSPTSASTSRSTAIASGPSRKSSPGTISTSSTAASTWPRSRPARSRSSKRWPGRCEVGCLD